MVTVIVVVVVAVVVLVTRSLPTRPVRLLAGPGTLVRLDGPDKYIRPFTREDVSEAPTTRPVRRVPGTRIFGPDPPDCGHGIVGVAFLVGFGLDWIGFECGWKYIANWQ